MGHVLNVIYAMNSSELSMIWKTMGRELKALDPMNSDYYSKSTIS